MKKYLPQILLGNLIFALVMIGFAIYAIAQLGFQPTSYMIAAIALVLGALVIYAFRDSKPMLVAGATLGLALVIPTQLGLVPMIVGAILFMLTASLVLYVDFDKGK